VESGVAPWKRIETHGCAGSRHTSGRIEQVSVCELKKQLQWSDMFVAFTKEKKKMINPGKTGMNWTKRAMALVLLGSMFSFIAMAQTKPEKPLAKAAADALVGELKEGLADLIEDEEAVAAIIEKWEARNLAGKTRTQILNLLFADVKSVVADKETLDGVWEDWQEVGLDEEEAEEETPVATPQKPAPAPPPATAPAPPAEQSTCRANAATSIFKSNRTEKFGLIRVGYRELFATGTVRCFDEKRGFGFITPDDGGADIFVHFTAINMDGFRILKEGQKVQYEIQIGSKGQRLAVNVRAA
jgi:CspA family cold shock protein